MFHGVSYFSFAEEINEGPDNCVSTLIDRLLDQGCPIHGVGLESQKKGEREGGDPFLHQ